MSHASASTFPRRLSYHQLIAGQQVLAFSLDQVSRLDFEMLSYVVLKDNLMLVVMATKAQKGSNWVTNSNQRPEGQ